MSAHQPHTDNNQNNINFKHMSIRELHIISDNMKGDLNIVILFLVEHMAARRQGC